MREVTKDTLRGCLPAAGKSRPDLNQVLCGEYDTPDMSCAVAFRTAEIHEAIAGLPVRSVRRRRGQMELYVLAALACALDGDPPERVKWFADVAMQMFKDLKPTMMRRKAKNASPNGDVR